MATDTTTRTITASAARDLALRLPHGRVTVAVDPSATTAVVTLRPVQAPADSAPPAIAAAAVQEDEKQGVLTVDVPRPTGPVAADVVLPLGARLVVKTMTAPVFTEGALAGLDVTTTTGAVDIDRVDILTCHSGAGAIRVRQVSGKVNASSVSGDVEVGNYTGYLAVVTSRRSDACLTVGRGATGLARVAAPTGRARLEGHLRDLNAETVEISAPEPASV